MEDLKTRFEARLHNLVSLQEYRRWFAPLSWRLSRNGETLTVSAPTIFHQRQLTEHHQKTIWQAAFELGLKIDELLLAGPSSPQAPAIVPPVRSVEAPGPAAPPVPPSTVDREQTFERFIIGESNRLAALALRKMAEQTDWDIWEAVITGGGAWGKSHLLNALANELTLRGEPFVKIGGGQFVEREEAGGDAAERAGWRQGFVSARFVIFDDIHLLEASAKAQRIFIHIFDESLARRIGLVVSAPRPPQELAGLSEPLRSRLAWGLHLGLNRPEFETLAAGAAQRAEVLNLKLSPELCARLVRQGDGDWRRVIGALDTLAWVIQNSGLGLEEAVDKFYPAPEISRQRAKTVDLDLILAEVARTFSLKAADIIAHNKSRQVTWPRRVAMYLARELTGLTTSEIGQALGRRDHSTVIHALKKINEELRRPEQAQVVENLKIRILTANE